jgi:hypothetical protein
MYSIVSAHSAHTQKHRALCRGAQSTFVAPRGATIARHGTPNMMSEFLERLRFLRRASSDGLISTDEYVQQRKRLLRAAVSITGVAAQGGGCASEAPSHQSKQAWHALIAALVEVIECNTADTRHQLNSTTAPLESPTGAINSAALHPSQTAAMRPQEGAAHQGENGERVNPLVDAAIQRRRGPNNRFAYNQAGQPNGQIKEVSDSEFDQIEIALSSLFPTQNVPSAVRAEPPRQPRMARPQRQSTTHRGNRTAQPFAPSPSGAAARAPAGIRGANGLPSAVKRAPPVWRPTGRAGTTGIVALQRRNGPIVTAMRKRPQAASKPAAAAAASAAYNNGAGMVRRAAEYVAEAAGLPQATQPRTRNPGAACGKEPMHAAVGANMAGDMGEDCAQPANRAPGARQNQPSAGAAPTTVRFTLHAEIVI